MGVLSERYVSKNSISKLGIRDYNMDVYAPLQTILVRYRNRDLITADAIRLAAMKRQGNVFIAGGNQQDENAEKELKNYHQIDRLVIQVDETARLEGTAEIIARMLQRRHYDVVITYT